MNKRIKLLAQRAGIHPTNFESDADLREPLEKLINSIVAECAVSLSTDSVGITNASDFYRYQKTFNQQLGLE